jgi:hypothetical protein
MTGGLKNKKSRLVFSGRLIVVFGHDWSRPPQRAHHQIAMFKDMVMGGIVSVKPFSAQANFFGSMRPNRLPARSTVASSATERKICNENGWPPSLAPLS